MRERLENEAERNQDKRINVVSVTLEMKIDKNKINEVNPYMRRS